MRTNVTFGVISTAIVLALASAPASAQTESEETSEKETKQPVATEPQGARPEAARPSTGTSSADARAKVFRLIGTVAPNSTIGRSVDRVLRAFDRQDVNGGGLTKDDAVLQSQMETARRRAREVQRFAELDLNGDGKITRAEGERALQRDANKPLRSAAGMIQPTEGQVAETLRRLMDQRMPKDGNGDGTVTLTEMYAAAKAKVRPRRKSSYTEARKIGMEFDTDKDGVVQREEVRRKAMSVLAPFDTDGDRVFSSAETIRINAEIRKSRRLGTSAIGKPLPKRPLRCDLPPLPKDAEVTVLLGSRATAMATVGLGRSSSTVGVVDVTIEPGDKKLVLFTGGYQSTIYRLSGAVERVARIISADRNGFTGIAANVVYWSDCRLQYSSRKARRDQMVASLADRLKRPVAHNIGAFRLGSVSLPSGKLSSTRPLKGAVDMKLDGDADLVWQMFRRSNPGGLVHIAARDVVAKSAVFPHKDMPQMAGIALLVQDGSLKVLDAKRSKMTVEITRAVTLPPGMRSLFGWRFVKGPDVPMPTFTGPGIKIYPK